MKINEVRSYILEAPMPTPWDSVMAIPQGPGLGIELDPAALAKFRVG